MTTLTEFAKRARARAKLAFDMYHDHVTVELSPSEDACRFCKAKAACPALLEKVQDDVGTDFENLDADEIKTSPMSMGENSLSIALAAVPLVEDWCKAVRAKVEADLLAGKRVPGFKLVQGRKGARKWKSEADAEATLKRMKLKVEEMYDLSLISPTTAEKLSKKGTIGPRQWPQLQSLIEQKTGGPSVAPETDPRPAYTPADDFEAINEEN